MVLSKEYRICMPLTCEEYESCKRAKLDEERRNRHLSVLKADQSLKLTLAFLRKLRSSPEVFTAKPSAHYPIRQLVADREGMVEVYKEFYDIASYYQIGQLYMIARHSLEQTSSDGEGVEIVTNEPCEDPEYGKGQFTEKRIHLSSRLPYWIQSICPRVFYVTEKSWNFFPFTKTEYTCSFVPKLNVSIKTKYENNNGSSENCLHLTEEKLKTRTIESIDIAFDELCNNKHYKKEEDPKFFKSIKTNRGPLVEGWRETDKPIMCSYKLVDASFEVFLLQSKVEDFIQRSIRDVLLLGHRQAFAWLDEWFGMTIQDVREYERKIQEETNKKLRNTNDTIETEHANNTCETKDECDDVNGQIIGTENNG